MSDDKFALAERLSTLHNNDGFNAFLETIENDLEGFDAMIDGADETNPDTATIQIFQARAQRVYAKRLLARLEQYREFLKLNDAGTP